ncbi:MerR family transcriptional regulator [Bacillus horti]|uniref:DNA-binding transcriptional MerR regulator n=1 Tax=Caldalkalibacillus horti TaxID=77523 RepID=A0ABT9VVF3_9BACI|nr:MerR family transcriptional regulator [Bacillus horti]MDQ0164807.1 DNA-binding transcriptional MerR regulator [Bacillus horti]
MNSQWKVGELADLTGLSIRTLRYYDQIGLFTPSKYTDAGHRRYTHNDLEKLHQILVLKQMGLSLDNIQELIKRDKKQSVMDVIETQMKRVQSEIEEQEHLLRQLKSIKNELSHNKVVSVKELTSLFELMKLNRSKYFTEEQLDELKAFYESLEKDAMGDFEKEFTQLLFQLRENKDQGIPPSHPTVKELALRWKKITYSTLEGNPELIKSVEAFYAENPDVAMGQGIDADLYAYIQKAL